MALSVTTVPALGRNARMDPLLRPSTAGNCPHLPAGDFTEHSCC
jgi:hypothetical protein